MTTADELPPKENTADDGTDKAATISLSQGRRGAPRGNSNALRHGLRAGKLPKDARYVENATNALRRTLEAAVVAARGAVSIPDAAAIGTAVKWERHGALCLRWLRIEGDQMKPDQRLVFSREIARASAERDRAIAALKLNTRPANPWDCLLPENAKPAQESGQ